MKLRRVCRCGHPKADHRGTSGPNSIGRSHGGECTNGSTVIAPYRFGGCQCWEFKARLLPQRVQGVES